jgi:nitrate/nitrite-specific signal transduction histidine kinase
MTVAFEQCGICPGCELEASLRRAIAEIDAFFVPKLTTAHTRFSAARTEERELPYRRQHRTAAAHRHLRRIVEGHQRFVGKLARYATLARCDRPRISVEASR